MSEYTLIFNCLGNWYNKLFAKTARRLNSLRKKNRNENLTLLMISTGTKFRLKVLRKNVFI